MAIRPEVAAVVAKPSSVAEAVERVAEQAVCRLASAAAAAAVAAVARLAVRSLVASVRRRELADD